MEHNSKTSLASVSTRSEMNVKPLGKKKKKNHQVNSGCPVQDLSCVPMTPGLPSHTPSYTMTHFQHGLWGVVDIPKLPFLQSASSELGRYEMLREFSRKTFSKVSSVYFYSLNSTTLPSNLSSIITNHEDFLPSILVSAGV